VPNRRLAAGRSVSRAACSRLATPPHSKGPQLSDVSRRKFLAASGASAIAVGVVTAAPLASASTVDADDFAAKHPEPIEESPLIVTVDDLKAGRISVMHGDREFSVVDAELAGRIAALARVGV
jgi:hypothetical protein